MYMYVYHIMYNNKIFYNLVRKLRQNMDKWLLIKVTYPKNTLNLSNLVVSDVWLNL